MYVCCLSSVRCSRMPRATWMRARGEHNSWAISPKNRFWPVTKPARRTAIRLIASPSRPSSSPRRSLTRVSNQPSEICSVARVIWESDRVMPLIKGNQNSTEKTNAPTPTITHGVGSKNKPPALSELEFSRRVSGQGRLVPGSARGKRMPIQYPVGLLVRTTNRASGLTSDSSRVQRGPRPGGGPRLTPAPGLGRSATLAATSVGRSMVAPAT